MWRNKTHRTASRAERWCLRCVGTRSTVGVSPSKINVCVRPLWTTRRARCAVVHKSRNHKSHFEVRFWKLLLPEPLRKCRQTKCGATQQEKRSGCLRLSAIRQVKWKNGRKFNINHSKWLTSQNYMMTNENGNEQSAMSHDVKNLKANVLTFCSRKWVILEGEKTNK